MHAQDQAHNGLPSKQMLAELQDLRETEEWKKTEDYFTKLHAPSFGLVSNSDDLSASPHGTRIAFTGSVWSSLNGLPNTRVCMTDLSTGSIKTITHGPHNDKKPKWSPDGHTLVFLSDRACKGQYQLYVLYASHLGEAQQLTSLDGVVEDFEWSQSGNALLIGLAGYGLAKSGFEGSGNLFEKVEPLPAWMPNTRTSPTEKSIRSIWLHDFQTRETRAVSRPGRNVWKFAWCGTDRLLALVSDSPREAAYRESALVKMSSVDGSELVIIKDSPWYMSLLTASPSGSKIAIIEAVSGDRTKLAGSIICIDGKSLERQHLESAEVDVTWLAWMDEERLFAMGLRGLESVALEINVTTREVRQLWTTQASCGSSYPRGEMVLGGGFAVIRQSWTCYPEIGIVDNGTYRTLASFDHAGGAWLRSQLRAPEAVTWKAPDGLEIQGFLHTPLQGKKPYPLILNVHGGPAAAFVDQWQGYRAWVAFLSAHGYAILNANPRGSTGRGRGFTSMVIGDVGGGDAQDLLSGIDDLVSNGTADPARLGVIGGSYGGFMSAWLTTQTTRFAAAIPIAPVTDWKVQYLTSDMHQNLLDGKPYSLDGQYVQRSPIHHVHRCITPTLQIVGSVDHCTPPGQAHQYHSALLDNGTKSVIAEYANEGHGVREFPAFIDACCRMLSWFDTYMPVCIGINSVTRSSIAQDAGNKLPLNS